MKLLAHIIDQEACQMGYSSISIRNDWTVLFAKPEKPYVEKLSST